jgi:hypothetical protein
MIEMKTQNWLEHMKATLVDILLASFRSSP